MYQRELFEATRRVFEEAAFAFVDLPDDSFVAFGEEETGMIAASITFIGPFSGTVALTTAEKVALAAASNMLGLEEDDIEAAGKTHDALGELLNMIAGNLLPAVAGVKPEFRINPPRNISCEEYRNIKETLNDGFDAVCLLVEGSPAEIVFSMESPETA